MNIIEIRISQHIEVKIKTHFLSTIFDNWKIDQLNQLMNSSRHLNMVEAKMAQNF